MPRLSLLNFFIGFFAIFVAACGGIFLSFDASEAFLHDKELLTSWLYTLHSSAHGHTNLFGLTHVAFGVSLPYSHLSQHAKIGQTIGLTMGTFAMSILMFLRAYSGPSSSFDLLGLAIGVCLSASLAALGSHCFGLAYKLLR